MWWRFTKEETEYLLVDCDYLGIQNVMALRGDSMAHQKFFEPSKVVIILLQN